MELITTRVCMASQIGVHGNLFGGEMMALFDESAAAKDIIPYSLEEEREEKLNQLLNG